jgi:protein TonB
MTMPPKEKGGTPPGLFARRARRNARLFVAFLAGSIAVHAAGLVALPGLFQDRDPTPVKVLEVALVQADPPPVMEAPAPAARHPRLRTPEFFSRATALPETSPQADPPAAALALPETRTQAAPSVMPLPRAAETRPAPPGPKTDVAGIAVAPASFSATYLGNPPPRYPPVAREMGVQGTVTLKVQVTREGLPARVDVEQTSGSTVLDQAALEAVRTWRFAPARRNGEAVEDIMMVPVVFRLEAAFLRREP